MSEVPTRISDARMDELIKRARNAATIGTGGGDGTTYREIFHPDVYKATLEQLIANERIIQQSTEEEKSKC